MRDRKVEVMKEDQHQEQIINKDRERKVKTSSLSLKVFALIVVLALLAVWIPGDQPLVNARQNERTLQFDDDYLLQKAKYEGGRRQFLNSKSDYAGLNLIESNLGLHEDPSADLLQAEEEEFARLDEIYHFVDIKKELPFCIIVQSLDFTLPYQFEYTFNSIFGQNYTNYKAIIFNFEESAHEHIVDYLKLNRVRKDNYVFIKNKDEKGVIENIVTASQNHCQKGSITLNVVGNSELIGKNVLKTFNAVYQTSKVGMVYSNFYTYNQGVSVSEGYNIQYSYEELSNIRKLRYALSAPVTYLTEHFLKINATDLKDQSGQFLDLAYEQAIYYPITEITCRRIAKIEGFHLLAKTSIKTYQQFKTSLMLKSEPSRIARSKLASQCDETFNNELKHKVMIHHRQYLISEPALKSISDKRVQKGGIIKRSTQTKKFEAEAGSSQKFAEYAYKDEHILKQREQFERQRLNLINLIDREDSKKMIKANLRLGEYVDLLQAKEQEYESYQAETYNKIGKYQNEEPFCIVVEQLEFEQVFRFEHVLNSIFNQNYTNYFAVIVNKNFKMDEIIRKYLSFYKINKARYVYLQNYEEKSPIEMLYNAITKYCSFDSIIIQLDGSGELLGKNTLQIFNGYNTERNGIVYSNHYLYSQSYANLHYSSTSKYTEEELESSNFRSAQKRYGQLITFRAELFFRIDVEDFQDVNGNFYDGRFNEHIYLSLLELACKSIQKFIGVHYISNEDVRKSKPATELSGLIRHKKNYNCKSQKTFSLRPSTIDMASLPELNSISQKHTQKDAIIEPRTAVQFNLLLTNEEGETIQQYLYKDEKIILNEREKYQLTRINYFKRQKPEDSRQLIPYNLKLDDSNDEEQDKLEKEQYQSIQQTYKNIDSTKESPVCIIVDRFNFNIPFKFEYTLNSIFLQNYTNFFVAIFNDGSKQGNYLLRKYLHFYGIAKERYVYVENKQNLPTLQVTEQAINSYCSKQSLVLNVAGEDELIGKNVFKIFNFVSQTEKLHVLYSNYYSYSPKSSIQYGKTNIYSEEQRKSGAFRQVQPKYGYPTFYTSESFRKVKAENFKFEGNQYYKAAVEEAIVTPLLEVSCGRMKKLPGVHYLYNSDRKAVVDQSLLAKERLKLQASQKVSCDSAFQLTK